MTLQIGDEKKDLEHITRQFNTVTSNNENKRCDINALRKERTLYDHIFKTLEYQILGQERKLNNLIVQNQKREVVIKESEENYNNIKELVSKNKYEDFYKIIEKEKVKYMEDLKALEDAANQGGNVYKDDPPMKTMESTKKIFTTTQSKNERLATRFKESQDVSEEDQKLEFYEQLFSEFRLKIANEDLDMLEEYMVKGDEINENIYEEFVELDNQCDSLKVQYDTLVKKVEKEETRTISTAVTKQPLSVKASQNYDINIKSTPEDLNMLIVI